MNLMNVSLVAALAYAAVVPAVLADDPYRDLPASIKLNATIRDFQPVSDGTRYGHPDFESYGNPYITSLLVGEALDADGKPVFSGRAGMVITKEFLNEHGKAINPRLFGVKLRKSRDRDDDRSGRRDGNNDDRRDGDDRWGWNWGGISDDRNHDDDGEDHDEVRDTPGELKSNADAGTGTEFQLTSVESFAQWYRDVPGVNMSKVVPLTLNRVPGTNRYVFDAAEDETYKAKGGFFPIDGEGFGDYAGWGKNFHFTTEIVTSFIYEQGKRHVFTFTGDDDVWVFIGGKLVLDVGGLHPQREQTLELDRLGLTDGERYDFRIFHAERHTSASNFRVETTLVMQPVALPKVTNLFD